MVAINAKEIYRFEVRPLKRFLYKALALRDHRQTTLCVRVYMKQRESMRVRNKALKIAHLNHISL